MLEIIGALVGGMFRLAPEAFRLIRDAGDRKHELKMLDREVERAKLRNTHELALQSGEAELAQIQGSMIALQEALRGQFTRTGMGFVDAMTWMVRPLVTYILLALYVGAKLAGMSMALDSGETWASVFLAMYDPEDRALFAGILSFWFVGRVFDKDKKAERQ